MKHAKIPAQLNQMCILLIFLHCHIYFHVSVHLCARRVDVLVPKCSFDLGRQQGSRAWKKKNLAHVFVASDQARHASCTLFFELRLAWIGGGQYPKDKRQPKCGSAAPGPAPSTTFAVPTREIP